MNQDFVRQKGRGQPKTGPGHQVVVRLRPGELRQIDSWILNTLREPITRAEAMRRLAGQALGTGRRRTA